MISPRLSSSLHSLQPVVRLFYKNHRILLLSGVVLACLTVLAGMALLGLSGWFISATAIAGLSAVTALTFDVFMPSSGIRLFTLARTFARYGERLISHDATLAVLADLRVRLFRGWAAPQAARNLALRPSSLLYRLTGDIDALDSLYLRLLIPLGAALAATLAASIALALIKVELGIAVLLTMTLSSLVILQRTWTAALRPARLRAHAIEALRSGTADLVSGQSELLLANRLDAQCQHIEQIDARLATYDDQLHSIDTRAALGFGLLSYILQAATLLVCGWLVVNHMITVPVAVLAVLVTLGMSEPLAALRRGALEMGRTTLAARRLNPQLTNLDESTKLPSLAINGSNALIMSNVTARYEGSSSDCLHGIDMQLQHGERIAVIGASGAGKSSLLSLLTGELSPRCGSLQIARHGWLTQRTELFQDTLRDNLRLANATASDDQLWQALDIAGLADTITDWPHGLDTLLGEGGLGLSGGQARRLALARLLLRKASIWLLDEPTDGLDAQTANDVLSRLDEHGCGHTWLLATHLRREAQLAERLMVIEHGRVTGHHQRGSQEYDDLLRNLRDD